MVSAVEPSIELVSSSTLNYQAHLPVLMRVKSLPVVHQSSPRSPCSSNPHQFLFSLKRNMDQVLFTDFPFS